MKKFIPFILLILLSIAAHLISFKFFDSVIVDNEFENLLHPIGFAVFSILLLRFILPVKHFNRSKINLKLYGITLLLCVSVGGIAEIAQYFFNRDASFDDLFRDALGACSGILLFLFFSKSAFHRNSIRYLLLIMSLSIQLILSIIFFKSFIYTLEARDAFPQLFSFEHPWESMFITSNDATIEHISPKEIWLSNKSTLAARITFEKGEYPGICFTDFYSDWTLTDTLKMSIFNSVDTTIFLNLRINDVNHNNDFHDRYNSRLTIYPGENICSIPISEIKTSLAGREMDLSKISKIILFGEMKDSGISFLLDSIYLVETPISGK